MEEEFPSPDLYRRRPEPSNHISVPCRGRLLPLSARLNPQSGSIERISSTENGVRVCACLSVLGQARTSGGNSFVTLPLASVTLSARWVPMLEWPILLFRAAPNSFSPLFVLPAQNPLYLGIKKESAPGESKRPVNGFCAVVVQLVYRLVAPMTLCMTVRDLFLRPRKQK